MITVEKLKKGTYFDDAFKISFRYDPTTVAIRRKSFITGLLVSVEMITLALIQIIKIIF